jgi:hypothetical protein
MTSKTNTSDEEKALRTLEEICENTRAIRRVVNRILDHLLESQEKDSDDEDDYDPCPCDWEDLDDSDDMYS